jgi:hypothetical protein
MKRKANAYRIGSVFVSVGDDQKTSGWDKLTPKT